jgi:undecaprenyl-diphosphatase
VPTTRRAWPALAGACLALFVAVTALVAAGGPLPRLDVAVRDAVRAHHEHLAARAADLLTQLLSPPVDAVVLAVGCLLLAWRLRSRLPLVAGAATGGTTAVVVVAVKAALDRRSPLDPGQGGSYPSGHTATALVCLGTLALLVGHARPRWRRPLVAATAAVTLVVAAALVYDSFHWLSDVVGSLALGVAVLAALHEALARRRQRSDPSSPNV